MKRTSVLLTLVGSLVLATLFALVFVTPLAAQSSQRVLTLGIQGPNPADAWLQTTYVVTATSSGQMVPKVSLLVFFEDPFVPTDYPGCTITTFSSFMELVCDVGQIASDTTATATITGYYMLPGTFGIDVLAMSNNKFIPGAETHARTRVIPVADASLTLTSSQTTAYAGMVFTYTMIANNSGWNPTSGIISGTLDGDATIEQIPSQCVTVANQIVCTDAFYPNEVRDYNVVVMPHSAGVISLSTTITLPNSSQYELSFDDNAASITTTVLPAQEYTPVCQSLTANPFTGTAPLYTTAIGVFSDPGHRVVYEELGWGDNYTDTLFTTSPLTMTHVYENPGTFHLKLALRLQNGTMLRDDACQATVTVLPPPPFVKGEVLIVNDDSNGAYVDYYTEAVSQTGRTFNTWMTRVQGAVPITVLLNYSQTVWYTGDDFSDALNSVERDEIKQYLHKGGQLFITGQDIGYYLNIAGETRFMSEILGASYLQDDANTFTLTGIGLLSDATISISGTGGANNQIWPDTVSPVGSTPIFQYFGRSDFGGVAKVLQVNVISTTQTLSGGPAIPYATNGLAPLLTHKDAIPGSFIVVMKPGKDAGQKKQAAIQASSVVVEHDYSMAFSGFSATLSDASVENLRHNPNVWFVEQNTRVEATDTRVNPPWGLDAIDQQGLPLNGTYIYTDSGSLSNVYVIDTGIMVTLTQYEGRATFDANFVDSLNNDCHGHGTHVAGTIASRDYGVSKAKLHAVKVLNCSGSGSVAGVIDGIEWVALHHLPNAVANMSLGGPYSEAMNLAITNGTNAGVLFVVAAGNSYGDACSFSPASAVDALTVSAVNSQLSRANWSNFGTCAKIFAPGVDVLSLCTGSSECTTNKSGTSMASPHVAGFAAILRTRHPNMTPREISSLITSMATPNVVLNPGAGSPNRFLWTGAVGTPSYTVIAGKPTKLVYLSFGFEAISDPSARALVMERVLTWLEAPLKQLYLPTVRK